MSKQVKQIIDKFNEKVEIAETVGKGRGKPSGNTFQEKQKSYMDMLNSKRIKEPKPDPLQYYKIQFDKESGNYVYFWKIFFLIILMSLTLLELFGGSGSVGMGF